MPKIIGLVNQKGGVGKTTTAVNLSAYLAALGKRVLLIDIDPQANATSGVGINFSELPFNLYHSLIGGILPEDVIKRTKLFGYDIMPSGPDLAGATVELVYTKDREFKLKDIVDKVSKNYDYILIDCPPSLGLLTINGLVAAREIIIPVQCEYYALEGLSHLLNTISLVKENLEKRLKIKGALLTMYDRRNKLSQEVKKEIIRNFPGYVFDTIIPRCIKLAEAPSFGKTILQYAPSSEGAIAYRSLAEEIISLDNRK